MVASLIVLVGCVVAAAIDFMPGTDNAFKSTFSTVPATLYRQPRSVKPAPAALALARKFIETAVERQNVDAAYDIVHPDIKGRLTRKEWDTGNIPVIGYPAGNAETSQFIVVYSYPTQMLLNVDLVAKVGSNVRPALLFFIGLRRKGDKPNGRWLVNYWEPHWWPPSLSQ